jgi:ribosomal protein S18 acetylase RimI-like enzyme
VIIRPFDEGDGQRLVEILKINKQFDWPDVEGVSAMQRVSACGAAVFLVADVDGELQGLVRAIYDGSRAIILLLSVTPAFQRRGIGTALVAAAESELRRRGAPTVSVTVTEASMDFWRKQGFDIMPIRLMLKSTL